MRANTTFLPAVALALASLHGPSLPAQAVRGIVWPRVLPAKPGGAKVRVDIPTLPPRRRIAITPVPDAQIGTVLRADARRIGKTGANFIHTPEQRAVRAVIEGRVGAAIVVGRPANKAIEHHVLGHHIAVVVVSTHRPLRTTTIARLQPPLQLAKANWAGVDGGSGQVRLWTGPGHAARASLVDMLRERREADRNVAFQMPSTAHGMDSEAIALERVAQDPFGMAIVSLASFTFDQGLRLVAIDRQVPTRSAHLDGTYPYGCAIVLIHHRDRPELANELRQRLEDPVVRAALARRLTL